MPKFKVTLQYRKKNRSNRSYEIVAEDVVRAKDWGVIASRHIGHELHKDKILVEEIH